MRQPVRPHVVAVWLEVFQALAIARGHADVGVDADAGRAGTPGAGRDGKVLYIDSISDGRDTTAGTRARGDAAVDRGAVELGQKLWRLTEAMRLQLRAEMFNAFNHPNFDNPRDASVGSPSFRSTVFAQTCCATVAPPSTQTIIQTGESSRVIQFALKLQF